MTGAEPNRWPIPVTQRAIPTDDGGRVVHNRELGERFPSGAAELRDGLWTKAAEQELLRVAGRSEVSA